MNYQQKKGFNQMMSILMLGLISAGGGVGVATFSQDQQTGLTQTTGGAGLREAISIENVEIQMKGTTDDAILTVRNTGTVDITLGDSYMNGTKNTNAAVLLELEPGVATTITFDIGSVPGGSIHIFKVTTTGGGIVTLTSAAPQ